MKKVKRFIYIRFWCFFWFTVMALMTPFTVKLQMRMVKDFKIAEKKRRDDDRNKDQAS